jgi:TRAP-type transport system periplasmic protein
VLVISLKTWNKLTPDVQKLLTDVAVESQKDESDIFHADEKKVVENLTAAGMKFNTVDTNLFYERVKPLWKSVEDTVGAQLITDVEKLRTK